ncbi:inner membrane protein YbjM [[Erwinia] mediterraneensis]|uniref:inner membrane protein YbjM n=1 Tax=[Erwinia] mediterraneensis TaxID=2161819 RepID=UPI00103198F5|nr:inner membrane protein YbjM [[Erwinia] mediterraneensis]
MSQRAKRWSAFIVGITLYSVVFIFASQAASNKSIQGEPELLLFLLPGMLMALLQPASPLKSTLLMALIVTLPGVLLFSDTLLRHNLLRLSAWSISALFWAGCGALLVRLAHALFSAWLQQSRP